MKINLLPAIACLISLIISCNSITDDAQREKIKKTLECNAEKSGRKWIVMPENKSGTWTTLRRVNAGDSFFIFTPDEEYTFKADKSGWKMFITEGKFEWTGKNPNLVCHEKYLWFMIGVVDDPPCGQ